jgi:hypothetical protein
MADEPKRLADLPLEKKMEVWLISIRHSLDEIGKYLKDQIEGALDDLYERIEGELRGEEDGEKALEKLRAAAQQDREE